ncbi:MAG: CBS domain-containing protein, partial [Candidatus Paceibacterota bacterium]
MTQHYSKKHYPKKSAGRKATRSVITARGDETLGQVEKRLHSEVDSLKMLQYVYVLDEEDKLLGVFSMRDLFTRPANVQAHEVMSDSLLWVHPHTDQEVVATKALKNGIRAMPVIDKDGVFLGVVTADAIFGILSEEHSEDLLYMGGVEQGYSASAIIKERLLVLLRARLPWLLIGLAGGLVAALLVERFEAVLENYIVLAFFLPLVVYMSDAVANQTLTILIRAMALDDAFSRRRYILRELGLGTSLAFIMGVLLFLVTLGWFGDPMLGLVLGVALFLAVIVAVLVALGMTFLLVSL